MAVMVVREFEVAEDDLSTTNYDGRLRALGGRQRSPQGTDRPHRRLYREGLVPGRRRLGVAGRLGSGFETGVWPRR